MKYLSVELGGILSGDHENDLTSLFFVFIVMLGSASLEDPGGREYLKSVVQIITDLYGHAFDLFHRQQTKYKLTK